MITKITVFEMSQGRGGGFTTSGFPHTVTNLGDWVVTVGVGAGDACL